MFVRSYNLSVKSREKVEVDFSEIVPFQITVGYYKEYKLYVKHKIGYVLSNK
jgi:hypothetical protein